MSFLRSSFMRCKQTNSTYCSSGDIVVKVRIDITMGSSSSSGSSVSTSLMRVPKKPSISGGGFRMTDNKSCTVRAVGSLPNMTLPAANSFTLLSIMTARTYAAIPPRCEAAEALESAAIGEVLSSVRSTTTSKWCGHNCMS